MRLSQILKTNLSYNAEGKEAFHKEGKRVLRLLVKELGLKKGEYEIRSNQGGIAVSGEVTLHADHWYIQVAQPCCQGGPVLWRLCQSQKDYTGMSNNYATALALEDVKSFALVLRKSLSSPAARNGGMANPGKILNISDEFMRRFAVAD